MAEGQGEKRNDILDLVSIGAVDLYSGGLVVSWSPSFPRRIMFSTTHQTSARTAVRKSQNFCTDPM